MTHIARALRALLLPGVLLLGLNGLPARGDDELPSLASLEWSVGEDGRQDLYLDLDLAIGGPRLLFSAARSRVENEFSDYDTEFYLLGLGSDPLDDFNLGAELEYWGRNGDFTVTSLRGVLVWNGPDWTAVLRPQRRNIVLATSDLCQRFPSCPDGWDITSYGLGLDATWYWRAWGFALGGNLNDYDRDLSPLATRAAVIRLFSPLALELATGLEDWGASLGLRRAFRRALLSLDEYRSVSAVDGMVSWLSSVRLSLDIDPHWRLRLSGGLLRMPALDQADTVYAGAGLVYAW